MYIYQDCTLEEVRTYRELQNEPFDFGSGLIIPENGGEEYYYDEALACSNLGVENEVRLQDWIDELTLEMEYDDLTSGKDMTRANRRKNNWKKAIRKAKNSKLHDYNDYVIYPNDKYEKALHLLDKGKSFCSCSLCTVKTNSKGKTYFGRTKIPYATRNWKTSDKKKILECDYGLFEYKQGKHFNLNRFWYWDDAEIETQIQLRKMDQEVYMNYILDEDKDSAYYANYDYYAHLNECINGR